MVTTRHSDKFVIVYKPKTYIPSYLVEQNSTENESINCLSLIFNHNFCN